MRQSNRVHALVLLVCVTACAGGVSLWRAVELRASYRSAARRPIPGLIRTVHVNAESGLVDEYVDRWTAIDGREKECRTAREAGESDPDHEERHEQRVQIRLARCPAVGTQPGSRSK